MPFPTFAKLVQNYPSTNTPCDELEGGRLRYGNQCAIRMSHALIESKWLAMQKYPKTNRCKHQYARGAYTLVNHIYRYHRPPDGCFGDGPGPGYRALADAETYANRRKGIIFFRELTGANCDHIDLWHGSRSPTTTYFGRCKFIWLFTLA